VLNKKGGMTQKCHKVCSRQGLGEKKKVANAERLKVYVVSPKEYIRQVRQGLMKVEWQAK